MQEEIFLNQFKLHKCKGTTALNEKIVTLASKIEALEKRYDSNSVNVDFNSFSEKISAINDRLSALERNIEYAMLELSNAQNPPEILSSKEPGERDRVAEDPLRLDTASLEDLRKARNAINKKITSKVKEEQKIKEEQKAKEEERKETKESSPTHPSFGAQSSAIANYPTGRPNYNHQGARNKGQRFKPNNSPNTSKYRGHTNRSHSKGKQRNKNGSQQNEF